MPANSTPIPAPKRLSKDLAARILDRAANVDATEEKVDVATLRAAAYDAGISPDAFERALAETAASVRQPTFAPQPTSVNGYEIASKTFWVGLVTGTLAILVASILLGPDDDATAGAVIGGGGALVGVFVHLLRTFRNRNK
jgi:hypothetical protein